MKRGILIVSICILASMLIFMTSRYTAYKDYREPEENSSEAKTGSGSDEIVGISDFGMHEDGSHENILENASTEASPGNENSQEGDIKNEENAEEILSGPETDEESVTEIEKESSGDLETEDPGEASSTESENEDSGEVSSTESVVEASGEQKSVLVFVDSENKVQQAEIDPYIQKHDYEISCFRNENGVMSYEGDDRYNFKRGIDVSHHNGDIDWNKVKESGIDFVMLRIAYRGYGAEGLLNEDKKFREYIDGAHAAGLEVGCYVFSQAVDTTEAVEEADFVISILKDYQIELPVVFDSERLPAVNARTDYISGEQITKNAGAFCERIEEAGYQPMVYADMAHEAFELNLKNLPDYSVWYADYQPYPQTPYHFEMWQYSNTGEVEGVEGMVDLDILLINS